MLISRRKLLQFLSYTAVPLSFKPMAGLAFTGKLIEFDVVDSNAELPLVFSSLCKLLTANPTLDNDLITRFYLVFKTEPYSEKHIRTTHKALLTHLMSSNQQNLNSLAFLRESELWFFQHLQTTLYTGVYYYEGIKPTRVTLYNALAFDSLSSLYPAPYAGSTGFSNWALRPTRGSV